MSIGANIKKMRELRNFTQSHMGELLNMSLSGYSKIERDETDISIKRLEQIAKILETDIKSILELDLNKVFNIHQQHAENGIQSGYVGVQNNFDEVVLNKYIEQLKGENEFLKELLRLKY